MLNVNRRKAGGSHPQREQFKDRAAVCARRLIEMRNRMAERPARRCGSPKRTRSLIVEVADRYRQTPLRRPMVQALLNAAVNSLARPIFESDFSRCPVRMARVQGRRIAFLSEVR